MDNGEQALDAMEKEKFDLVMLDLHMPVMGGLEAAKVSRFTREGASRLPLVALTADATPESRKACEEAGFDGYLTKPVEVQKLIELIDSLVPAGRKSLDEASTANPSTAGLHVSRPGGTDEVIDPVIFNELVSLGSEGDFLENLIKIFLENGEQRIKDIEKAQLAGKYVLVSELSHGLKGSAGQIGAVTLMELCHRMSHISPADLVDEGITYVKTLKEEFARVRAALQRFADQDGRRQTSGEISPPHSSYR